MNTHAHLNDAAFPPKPLELLLRGLATVEPRADRDIAGVSLDSRRINPDDLFIAVPGEVTDGRDHIQQAVDNGAAAVAREALDDDLAQTHRRGDYGVPSFDIAGLRRHISGIAARFFDHPSAHLRLIGITGTNGKTTCAYLLAQALDRLGQRCALMSTIGAGFIGELAPAALTTADAVTTQRTLAQLRARGAQAVCMEVSSHGLEQGRVNQVEFDIALLTNLSRDHLDYHGSMQRYARAKQRLFQFDGLGCAVINVDDPFGRRLLRAHGADRCIGYGLDNGDLRLRALVVAADGIAFEAHYRGHSAQVRSPLLGAVNVPNLLAAIAALLCCGYDLEQIARVAGDWRAPPGRMELAPRRGGGPAVVIDYAHTPDALERALLSLRELCGGKLWLVFGCGGERDSGKRAPMGQVAERCADRVIITDDNPRFESPQRIAAQIASGMNAPAEIIHSRRRAIETALARAAADDIVLIAGKGHESTQSIGARVIPLNDRDIVAAAAATAGGAS